MDRDATSSPSNPPTPSGAERTTGGRLQWQPPDPAELGAMLSPHYEVLCLLGHGGMGAVYKGRHVRLKRLVAIKLLPPDLADDLQFAARFEREAQSMAALSHPAIVPVYDFGEMPNGWLYFVMEFVDGTDVLQMIRQQGRLPAEHALAITAHLCDALHYAHTHGVVHRDIKPANILLNSEGAVKVADFGLAKRDGDASLTLTDTSMGTPDYIAPEALAFGSTADHRADLYAVGVMLYHMLTGEVPRGMFDLPSVRFPGTDARHDRIIAKAMKADPAQRYQSAAEIRGDLDDILTVPVAQVDAGGRSSAAVPKQARPEPAGEAMQVQATIPWQHPVRGKAPGAHAAPGAVAPATAAAPGGKLPLLPIAVLGIMLLSAAAFFLFRGEPDAASVARHSGVESSAPTSSKTQPSDNPQPSAAEKPAPASGPSQAKQPVNVRPTKGGRLHVFGCIKDVGTPLDPGPFAKFDDFVQVIAGSFGFAALRANGTVIAQWRYGSDLLKTSFHDSPPVAKLTRYGHTGQFGLTENGRLVTLGPQVSIPLPQGEGFTWLSCGSAISVGVKADGSVVFSRGSGSSSQTAPEWCPKPESLAPVTEAWLSEDGDSVVLVGKDGIIRAWHRATGEVRPPLELQRGIVCGGDAKVWQNTQTGDFRVTGVFLDDQGNLLHAERSRVVKLADNVEDFVDCGGGVVHWKAKNKPWVTASGRDRYGELDKLREVLSKGTPVSWGCRSLGLGGGGQTGIFVWIE